RSIGKATTSAGVLRGRPRLRVAGNMSTKRSSWSFIGCSFLRRRSCVLLAPREIAVAGLYFQITHQRHDFIQQQAPLTAGQAPRLFDAGLNLSDQFLMERIEALRLTLASVEQMKVARISV